MKLKKVVLIGGPQDETITPWQSRFDFAQFSLLFRASYLEQFFSYFSQFGFYNTTEDVEDMTKQKVRQLENFKSFNSSTGFSCYPYKLLFGFQFYIDDLFGLRSLDERGAVHRCTCAGVKHHNWHTNETVCKTCIEPWLT